MSFQMGSKIRASSGLALAPPAMIRTSMINVANNPARMERTASAVVIGLAIYCLPHGPEERANDAGNPCSNVRFGIPECKTMGETGPSDRLMEGVESGKRVRPSGSRYQDRRGAGFKSNRACPPGPLSRLSRRNRRRRCRRRAGRIHARCSFQCWLRNALRRCRALWGTDSRRRERGRSPFPKYRNVRAPC